MKKALILTICLAVCCAQVLWASQFYDDVVQFIDKNPDGNKYEFVKTYITSLTYILANEVRRENEPQINSGNLEDSQSIGEIMDGLTLDSVNWRIAKNMLKRYRSPDNGLILKVTDLFLQMSDEQIEYNSHERFLMGQLYEAQISGNLYSFDSYKFFQEIQKLAALRKESMKKMLESAILVTKVLISSEQNEYGELDSLGVTDDERDRLLFKLDDFYGPYSETKVYEGQSFLQASIATLKDFLTDYSWKSQDDFSY